MLCKVKCVWQQNPLFSFIQNNYLLRKEIFFWDGTMQEITFPSCGFVSYKALIPFALDENEIFIPTQLHAHPIGYLE